MDASARRSFHIGRYHCVEALAQSPLGETFRAKVYGVAGLEKQYALKQIDAAVRVDPILRARLVEAARRYATLDHERIAKLTEIHDEGDSLYLVVELARGIDLLRLEAHLRARGESMPVEQAILVAVDIAEALDGGQERGVLHEGISPQVIAVLGEGEVRVSDFALAGTLERPGWASDDALAPVLAYMAPERVAGSPATAAADAWSVGAIAYELLTGQSLVSGATIAEINASRSAGPAWDKLPSRPGLRELLQKLLSDDPATRPQSAAQLREALAGLLGLEIGRARAGLQALAKRALGRALTRTGSFAAVAIQSGSMPTLQQESTPPPPSASPPTTLQSGKRTIIGVATHAVVPPPPPPPPSQAHAWAPPRTTGAIPIVRPETIPNITTLQGMGEPAPASPAVPEMELAELPPSASSEVTEKSQALGSAFEEGVTSPQALLDEPVEALEEPTLLGDGSSSFEVNGLDITQHGGESVPPPLPPPSGRHSTLPAVPSPSTPIPTQPSQLTIEMTAEVPPSTEVTKPVPKLSADDVSTPPVGNAVIDATITEPMAALPPQAAAAEIETNIEPAPTGRTLPLPKPTPPTIAQSKSSSGGAMAGVIALILLVVAGAVYAIVKPRPTPTVVARNSETQMTEEPKTEQPKAEEPKTEEPKTVAVAPKTEEPKTVAVAPKTEEPKAVAVAPKTEEPKAVAPKTEEPKAETPKPPLNATPGQLTIASTPPGAQVWLDGENKGTTPLAAQVPAGKHRLVLLHDGDKMIAKQITVEASGFALDQPLEPAKLPPEVSGTNQGGLKVRCRTLGELRILVDGADSGFTCPNDTRIPVTPGSHQIGLYSPRTGETHELDGEILEDADHSTRIYVRY